ncbi:MAG: hypothetical protein RLZZ58_2014 [Pseudomonadota bacterium]
MTPVPVPVPVPAPVPATIDDAPAIAAIYAHHVAHGTGSYDLEPRSVDATAAMIADFAAHGWPFLVVRDGDGGLCGYAYASQFRPRPAYAFACEDSIYIHPDWQGQGVGRMLLDALIDAATAAGFRTMVAVIGGAEPGSIALHARCGFVHAGRLAGMGWKHDAWRDNVFMQRALGDGMATAPTARAP